MRLNVEVDVRALPLSPSAKKALAGIDRYDVIAFTSKNAQEIFEDILKKARVPLPHERYLRVGPREDLLKQPLKDKRVLFPRSDLAPYDIVRKLRSHGVHVIPISIYTARGRKLSVRDRQALLRGKVTEIYFKSPSGIDGLLEQLPRNARYMAKAIPALCIGETTAKAAKTRGWKKISIKKVV